MSSVHFYARSIAIIMCTKIIFCVFCLDMILLCLSACMRVYVYVFDSHIYNDNNNYYCYSCGDSRQINIIIIL